MEEAVGCGAQVWEWAEEERGPSRPGHVRGSPVRKDGLPQVAGAGFEGLEAKLRTVDFTVQERGKGADTSGEWMDCGNLRWTGRPKTRLATGNLGGWRGAGVVTWEQIARGGWERDFRQGARMCVSRIGR